MKKLKRFFIAVLLLPACYGVTQGVWSSLRGFRNVPEGSFYFFGGFVSYFAFQWAFFRPIRTYVFGHELSHAVAAWLSGAKVKHFHVSKKGGSVSVSKSNVFIALAPYIIPLYALIVMALYFAASYFFPAIRAHGLVFLWVLGASLGFHMALTTYALKMDQPDLKAAGKFLSAVIIYLGNVVAIMFCLGVLFPKTVSWGRFARITGAQTMTAVKEVGRGTEIVWESASRSLSAPPK